jgi:hypothetical protein
MLYTIFLILKQHLSKINLTILESYLQVTES